MTVFYGKKNNATSKIADVGGIDAATDPITFNVTTGEGSKFPSSNFQITIGNEIMNCTTRTGDALTAARAKEGTSMEAHSQNSVVDHKITAAQLVEYETPAKFQGMDYAADAGAIDDYAVALTPVPTAYFIGMIIKFKANTANTGPSTLNVNALGAKTIKKNYNSDLETGDILANQILLVIYDGTNFQMLSQASQLTSRLFSKIIVATRDMAAASGDVAYTGVGFTPTAIIVLGAIIGGFPFVIGMIDSAALEVYITPTAANVMSSSSGFIAIALTGSDAQKAALKTFDADGFTLTWTKAGTPTGTVSLMFMCFR